MTNEELVKKFLNTLIKINKCYTHIKNGRLDKAILLFNIIGDSIINNNSDIIKGHGISTDAVRTAMGIYHRILSGSVYGAVDTINSIIGTKFTRLLDGPRSGPDKYYIIMKATNGAYVQIKKLIAGVNNSGQWVLKLGTGNSDSFADILLFDTEQEAQTFLDNSKLAERDAYKNNKFEIKQLISNYVSSLCIRDDPIECVAVNMPIYYLQHVVGNANVWLFSPPLSLESGVFKPTTEALINQYQL